MVFLCAFHIIKYVEEKKNLWVLNSKVQVCVVRISHKIRDALDYLRVVNCLCNLVFEIFLRFFLGCFR